MASTGTLQGKVALVTGGSGGIGSQVCVNLAGQGASVVVVDLVAADDFAAKIAVAVGGRAIAVKADVTKSAEITAAFDKAVEAFGAVHIVVHLAGIILGDFPSIQNTTEEDWDRIFLINCKGTFLVAKEAANRLGPGGRIVTSSLLAQSPTPGIGAYSCTKAAVDCMVKVLAKELAGRKITINAIAPGPVKTPMLLDYSSQATMDELIKACPMGRLGEATDIAPLIQFLVSDEAEWVNGEIHGVTGGLH